MAVVDLKSLAITARDANPIEFGAPSSVGILREAVGTVEGTASNSIGSIYRMVSIPSSCRVSQVLLFCDDLGSAGDADIGLYKSTLDGGAVVDADFFGAAVDVNAAALNGSDVTHESAVFGLEDAEKTVWQALGLSADPQLMYDVCLTLTEASTDAGTIMLKVRYVY